MIDREEVGVEATGVSARVADLSPAKQALLAEWLAERRAGRGVRQRSGDGPAPLSFSQRILWLSEQMGAGRPAYHVPMLHRVRGPLDAAALGRAFAGVIARHDVLRARFLEVRGEPSQVVSRSLTARLETIDLSNAGSPEGREEEARRRLHALADVPFDLANGPPIRAILVRLAPDDHLFLVVAHHLVTDGVSGGLLLRDLDALYATESGHDEVTLPPLPFGYLDFAAWQRERLQGAALERLVGYWKEQLAGAPSSIDLPVDHRRGAARRWEGGSHVETYPAELLVGLGRVANERGATLFMVLLAAYQALLHRYSRQNDLVVGSPFAGRSLDGTENLVGCFINTLPLRARFSGALTFAELLAQVRAACLGAYAHQDAPYERLLLELTGGRPERDDTLYSVLFALQNRTVEPTRLGDAQLEPVPLYLGTSKLDLSLSMRQSQGRLRAALEYRADLFDAATAQRFLAHLRALLEGIVAAPDSRVDKISLASPDERDRVVVEWNRTARSYQRDETIDRLFHEQAVRTPESIAISCGEESVTYGELDARTNRLAWHLRALGVSRGAFVGVCLERSIALIVAMLGALKAGAAYVPLDPEYPKERLAFMIGDTALAALVTRSGLRNQLPHSSTPVVLLDEHAAAIAGLPESAPGSGARSSDCADVLFTSGSTGLPKGVMLPHRGAVRVATNTDYMDIGPGDVMAQVASPSFDAATWEIWGALLNGARLTIIQRDVALVPEAFAAELQDQGVTVLFLTTALFNQLARHAPDALRGVRFALFGGEPADPHSVSEVLRMSRPGKLLHMYGPTETSVYATSYQVEALEEGATGVPIGRPISNTTAYVLDEEMQPVPVGVPGELYIGGDGVALGYHERPALTDERFLPDPFAVAPGGRLYRTGDLVRWRVDGVLEFLARMDDQVKLRGFRIEPGEVEMALRSHPDVDEATVQVRRRGESDRQLVGYFVARPGAALGSRDLREHLKSRLPDYMVPAALVALERLPLSPTGKVNRAALPEPDWGADAGQMQAEPATDLEAAVAAVWCDVLGLERLGVEASFFDLGGHSLLATQILARLFELFSVQVPMRQFFARPTVRGVSAALEEASPDAAHLDSVARALLKLRAMPPDERRRRLAGANVADTSLQVNP